MGICGSHSSRNTNRILKDKLHIKKHHIKNILLSFQKTILLHTHNRWKKRMIVFTTQYKRWDQHLINKDRERKRQRKKWKSFKLLNLPFTRVHSGTHFYLANHRRNTNTASSSITSSPSPSSNAAVIPPPIQISQNPNNQTLNNSTLQQNQSTTSSQAPQTGTNNNIIFQSEPRNRNSSSNSTSYRSSPLNRAIYQLRMSIRRRYRPY